MTQPLVTMSDNLLDVEPRFLDAVRFDFWLHDDSPAWKVGFQWILFEEIGLYRSDERTTWPIANSFTGAR